MLAVVMKMAKQSELVIGHQLKVWLMVGAVLLSAPAGLRAINVVAPATDADNPVVATAPAASFSRGVADIVKMVEAKVDPAVIKTYIKSSPTAYNPTAKEIIALKDEGVPAEILTAMLQRGAEVRAQSMLAAQAVPNAAAPQIPPGTVNPYAVAPGYDYSAQPVYPNYTYSYPAYAYDYPSYAYGYPAYSCGYSWPYCSFGFGCYPFGGYCGYPYGRYGSYWGGRGYYGGGYFGRGHFGGRGYYGNRSRPVSFAGSRGGFQGGGGISGHSFGGGGRPAGFSGSAGGFRGGGGVGGHSASFGGRGGGGFGGHSGGRGR